METGYSPPLDLVPSFGFLSFQKSFRNASPRKRDHALALPESARGESSPHGERSRRARIPLQRFIDSTRGLRAISALDGERGQAEERLDAGAAALHRFTAARLVARPVSGPEQRNAKVVPNLCVVR